MLALHSGWQGAPSWSGSGSGLSVWSLLFATDIGAMRPEGLLGETRDGAVRDRGPRGQRTGSTRDDVDAAAGMEEGDGDAEAEAEAEAEAGAGAGVEAREAPWATSLKNCSRSLGSPTQGLPTYTGGASSKREKKAAYASRSARLPAQ